MGQGREVLEGGGREVGILELLDLLHLLDLSDLAGRAGRCDRSDRSNRSSRCNGSGRVGQMGDAGSSFSGGGWYLHLRGGSYVICSGQEDCVPLPLQKAKEVFAAVSITGL